jgi:hypothetical protein
MDKRSGAPSRGSVHRDRGSVTLEAALAVPLLLLVAAALMWALGVAIGALAMGDAVRTSARLIARGDAADLVMSRLQQSLPDSDLTLESRGGDVEISAERFVSLPIPVFRDLGITLTQTATAPVESFG